MSERSVAPNTPPNRAMLEQVREGLSRPQKELPPKFSYDVRGSELFEEITQLPEYYLSRTERGLLERWMPEWMADAQPRSLVELGAGSAAKTRIILDSMRAVGEPGYYLPIDVSAEFLRTTTDLVRLEYPGITASPLVADIAGDFDLPGDLPVPMIHAFLGSTIGNFAPAEAASLLSRVRRAGWVGLGDAEIGREAPDLFEIGMAGAAALREEFLQESDLEIAREFFDRYTRRGRSPADDLRMATDTCILQPAALSPT